MTPGALTSRWQRFWFAPQPATTLAVCRLLFFGLMFWYYLDQRFAPWAEVSRAFWQPIWVFEKFRIPVLGAGALQAGEIFWKVSLALACVGLITRFSTATAFVLGFYLLGLRHNWGKASHDDATPVWIMLIFALSRCGDALSIDALFRKPKPDAPLPLESGEYRWPIRAVWLVLSMVFFNSAIAKLRRSGLDWALSENLSVLMVRLNYFNKPATDWGLHLANIRGFGQLMALGALAVELLFPLVLFSRIARWILVPMAFLMQLGNKFLLGVDFTVFMFAYVFFIDWGWLLARARRGGRTASPVAQETIEEPAPPEPMVHADEAGDAIYARRAQVRRIPPRASHP